MKGIVLSPAYFEIISTVATILAGLIGTGITYNLKDKYDVRMKESEDKEIDKEIEKINNKFIGFISEAKESKQKNVLNMMIDNVSELREYYVISKQQARKSFSAALFICFFGIIIYLIGIIAYLVLNKDISIITIIGGTVVEVIAGLFFWLYREATKQLGIYHQRLGSTEKYLTVIQIIKEMPEDKQSDSYSKLIEAIISDNKEIIAHEK